jgi:hypothetical protein
MGVNSLKEDRRLRMSEKRVLRSIFGPKRDEVAEEWRKLHNEELHDLYSSPNIIRVTKSRRMRCPGFVTRMGYSRGVCGFWFEDLGERTNFGVDGRIILKWIFKNWDVESWTGLIWLTIRTDGRLVNAVISLQVL